jgi:hypothetical protein
MSVDVLPPVVGALFIVAILAAIMSTVAGIMIVSASAISHDFYSTMIRPQASDREKLLVNRVAVFLLAILPISLTLQEFDLVQFIVLLQASLTASFFFCGGGHRAQLEAGHRGRRHNLDGWRLHRRGGLVLRRQPLGARSRHPWRSRQLGAVRGDQPRNEAGSGGRPETLLQRKP